MIAASTIETDARAPFARRLAAIHHALEEVLETHRPDLAAVEAPFHGVNARSALQLAHARGVILAVLGRARIETAEYSPAQIKKSVTGSGRADKLQVSFMVERLAGLTSSSRDLTDAVAVALCHQVRRLSDPAALLVRVRGDG